MSTPRSTSEVGHTTSSPGIARRDPQLHCCASVQGQQKVPCNPAPGSLPAVGWAHCLGLRLGEAGIGARYAHSHGKPRQAAERRANAICPQQSSCLCVSKLYLPLLSNRLRPGEFKHREDKNAPRPHLSLSIVTGWSFYKVFLHQ